MMGFDLSKTKIAEKKQAGKNISCVSVRQEKRAIVS